MGSKFSGASCALAAAATAFAAPARAERVCTAVAERAADSRAETAQRSVRQISIPFAPPLRETLRYRLRSVTWGRGQRGATEAVFTLRFQRNVDGHRVAVTPLLTDAERRAVPLAAAAFAERPMIFRLHPDGRVAAMEEERAFWAALDAVVGELQRQGSPPTSDWQKSFLPQMQMARANRSDEERIATLSAPVATVLAHAGATFAATEPCRGMQRIPTMFGTATAELLRYRSRLTRGMLSVTVDATPPPLELEGLLQAFFPTEADLGVRASSYRFETEVSRSTGLVHRSFAEIRAEVDAGGRRDRLLDSHEIALIGVSRHRR